MQGMLRATVDQLARGHWDNGGSSIELMVANPVHTILGCKGKECTIMICQGWPAPHFHVPKYARIRMY